MERSFRFKFGLLAAACFGVPSISVSEAHGQIVRFVDRDAPCTGSGCDGTEWSKAYRTLQDALDFVHSPAGQSITQIWVAAGTYYPDEGGGHTDNDRTETFLLRDNLRIMAGFNGTETDMNERNPFTNVTTLSGAIGGSGNSYHVVTSIGNRQFAILDGFTIRDGDARDAPELELLSTIEVFPPGVGGGMVISSGPTPFAHPTILRCKFLNNKADYGGAIWHDLQASDSSAQILICTFDSNTADIHGGAYYGYTGQTMCPTAAGGFSNHPEFVNCVLRANAADLNFTFGAGAGGAAFVEAGAFVRFLNCTIFDNTAANGVGQAIHQIPCPNNPLMVVESTIVWDHSTPALVGNYCITFSAVPTGVTGNVCGNSTNTHQNPQIIDNAGHIDCSTSPCVDMGVPQEDHLHSDFVDADQDGCTAELLVDIDLENRVMGGDPAMDDPPTPAIPPRIDIGAHEVRKRIEVDVCHGDIAPPPAGPCLPPGNGVVNVDDLLAVINAWTPSGGECARWPNDCYQDFNPGCLDRIVGVDELLIVINNWGPCTPEETREHEPPWFRECSFACHEEPDPDACTLACWLAVQEDPNLIDDCIEAAIVSCGSDDPECLVEEIAACYLGSIPDPP